MTDSVSLPPRVREPLPGLLTLALEAHGGLDRWLRFTNVSAHLVNGGALWGLKQQPGVLDEVNVSVALRRPWASHFPFGEPHLRTSFEPQRIAIETIAGEVVEERRQPRDSFKGHELGTPWDRLQLAYFAGYAMWTYLTTPFLFAMDGIHAEEVAPWHEQGETWRRLRVNFPERIATHSATQTFYFDSGGLLRRHDYDTEVVGGTPAAHYVAEYREYSGILVPTRRRVLGRAPDGTAVPEPLIVSIDLSDIQFN